MPAMKLPHTKESRCFDSEEAASAAKKAGTPFAVEAAPTD